MNQLLAAMLIYLGRAVAGPGEVAEVPLVIETDGQCVVDIETVIESDIPVDIVIEGPNVLSFLRVAGSNRYRVEFEASGCPNGEVARIGFILPGNAQGAYPLRLIHAALRLESGELIETRSKNGQVKVR